MTSRPSPGNPRFAVALVPVLVFIVLSSATACGGGTEAAPHRSSEVSEPSGPAPSARRMALTFDDLPAAPPRVHDTATQRVITDRLLASLEAHRAPAIGFVNEQKLEDDGGATVPDRVALLERWLDAGHELGNHTYSHPDLHRVDLETFQEDLIRGERVTAGLLAERGRKLRFFRHPFLHTGRDLETKHALERFLAGRGYRVAPVTIDNSEWIFGGAYARAFERGGPEAEELMERLGAAYVPYMERVVEYYEGQSRALFDREIPQVLLVHAYLLNADHLDALLERLEERGYAFISLEEALEDPAYRSPDTFTGPGGITWLHRWAITRDVDRTIFAAEPEIPEWVFEAAGVDSY